MLEQFPNAVSITRSLLHGVSKKKGVLLKHRFVNLARSRLSPRLNLDTLVLRLEILTLDLSILSA